jgi:hypothetical protein
MHTNSCLWLLNILKSTWLKNSLELKNGKKEGEAKYKQIAMAKLYLKAVDINSKGKESVISLLKEMNNA